MTAWHWLHRPCTEVMADRAKKKGKTMEAWTL